MTSSTDIGQTLQTLLQNSRSGPHISLFMPTVKAGPEVRQNSIRYKNLLNQAKAALENTDLSSDDKNSLFASADELIEDSRFWEHQDEGLAVFLAQDFHESHPLPLSLPELCVVGPHFYVKPLFRLNSENRDFYILTLSQNQVRLLTADRFQAQEVDLQQKGIKTSLDEVLGEQLSEQQLQHHSGTTGGEAVYHAQGAGNDDIKPELHKFFSYLDQELRPLLGSNDRPLILAGVDYLLPIYRGLSDYKPILEQGITGNVERLSPQELQQQAWPLLEPQLQRRRDEAVERFHSLRHEGRASVQLDEIVTAALDGRIDTLFVAADEQQWGHYDPATRKLERHQEPAVSNEDLLDLAARHTFQQGGSVYVRDAQEMPDETTIAAIYRY